MTCKNYMCQNEAAPNMPCCDSQCGFEFKGDVGQIRKVLFEDMSWLKVQGFSKWSVGRYLYYKQLI